MLIWNINVFETYFCNAIKLNYLLTYQLNKRFQIDNVDLHQTWGNFQWTIWGGGLSLVQMAQKSKYIFPEISLGT